MLLLTKYTHAFRTSKVNRLTFEINRACILSIKGIFHLQAEGEETEDLHTESLCLLNQAERWLSLAVSQPPHFQLCSRPLENPKLTRQVPSLNSRNSTPTKEGGHESETTQLQPPVPHSTAAQNTGSGA